MNKFKSYISNFYSRHVNILNIIFLSSLVFTVFYNSLDRYYSSADDFSSLLHSERNFIKAFISNTYGQHSGGDYRPLEVIPHQIGRNLYGDNPFARRLTNLIFHMLNVILIYILSKHLTANKWIALTAGLLFSVHIIHAQFYSQPVTWISGRVELFLTFFYVLSIIFFVRFLQDNSVLTYLLSLTTFILALFSKEMAITLPIIIFAYTLIFQKTPANQQILRRLLLIFFTIALLLMIITFLFDSSFLEKFSSDGVLEKETILQINRSRLILMLGSLVSLLSLAVFLSLNKMMKSFNKFVSKVGYSIPYFYILMFYLVLRLIVLESIGGLYNSESGQNLIFNIHPETFVRDLFSLAGFFLPLGNEFVVQIFNLYTKHNFIFYSLGIIIFIILIILLYKIYVKKEQMLLFNYLWIFITLLPVHNFTLNLGGYETRYLYLSSIGFCLIVAIVLYKIKMRNRFLRTIVYFILAIVLISSSFLIIKNNEILKQLNAKTERLIFGLKSYNHIITPTKNLFFLSLPISTLVHTAEPILSYRKNIYDIVKLKMNDILNFTDIYEGHRNNYFFDFLFFIRDVEKYQITVDWIDEKTFIMNHIDPKDCYFVVDDAAIIKKYGSDINYAKHGLSVVQSFSYTGEIKTSDLATVQVLEIDKNSHYAKMLVKLNYLDKKSELDKVYFLFDRRGLSLVTLD